MEVIVDDYGYSAAVNALVERAVAAGVIDGAAVMTNCPGSQAALATLAADERIAYGLHLNLTEGRSLLPTERVRSLVDEAGTFLGWSGLMRRLATGQVRLAELTAESEAQLARLATVRRPAFFTSHHHVHLFPTLTGPLAELARQHGVTRIRLPRRIWWPSSTLRHGLKALVIQGLGALSPSHELTPMAACLVDLDWVNPTPERLASLLDRVPDDAELICHPYPSPSTLEWLLEHRRVRT